MKKMKKDLNTRRWSNSLGFSTVFTVLSVFFCPIPTVFSSFDPVIVNGLKNIDMPNKYMSRWNKAVYQSNVHHSNHYHRRTVTKFVPTIWLHKSIKKAKQNNTNKEVKQLMVFFFLLKEANKKMVSSNMSMKIFTFFFFFF